MKPYTDTLIPRPAFPLRWPAGRERLDTATRKPRSQAPYAKAYDGLIDELRRFGAINAVISSNVPCAPRGEEFLPIVSAAKRVADPGVAVYFQRDGRAYAISLDVYQTVAGNLRAIAVTLKAMRDVERHGASVLLERSMDGFREIAEASSVEKKAA